MERGFSVSTWSLVLATLVLGGTAQAAPKKKDARKLFEKGLAASGQSDYPGAVDALSKSFAIEEDKDTLLAWAQAEQQQEHCEKAIQLYEKVLLFELKAPARKAVGVQIETCRASMLQTTAPVDIKPVVTPAPEPVAAPEPAPVAPLVHTDDPPSRWKSPLGLGLIGVGVVGVGVGSVFLLQAKKAESDQDNAATYGEWLDLRDKAKSRGTLGLVSSGVGAACIVGGIVYIVTRKTDERASQASVWLTPDGGGVFATGRF